MDEHCVSYCVYFTTHQNTISISFLILSALDSLLTQHYIEMQSICTVRGSKMVNFRLHQKMNSRILQKFNSNSKRWLHSNVIKCTFMMWKGLCIIHTQKTNIGNVQWLPEIFCGKSFVFCKKYFDSRREIFRKLEKTVCMSLAFDVYVTYFDLRGRFHVLKFSKYFRQ